MTADETLSLLSDLHRIITEYHWRWGIVTQIINRRYDTNYTAKQLRKMLEKDKQKRPAGTKGYRNE